ncbi:sodium:proton antiporter [Terribacillus saccharophilus]|jgi:monovalent cation:H+ antiporter-2, CPA2 family|uniref:Sodium:proton antiporter n=1 Tax=Terribacillus saccharophilus TaxID=361277 RepID=A0A268HB86_9BACI|nr:MULTISPECIES: monovalent cation:proton antiporter family protein [Terribacillus]PAD34973.1 sodium:proton antiporter [Terribacillus saccharophilus]PAD95684.1 sodium:proton antiporter [Terribacillus saccharophilus]PAD99254.1 sodium:proton antiporter [Terribacillus saccharophilus]PAE07147.1 sodium:proton antiporter [Terribacillus saccharophilus]
MEHESIISLVVVILAAFLTPILMNRLKLRALPVVVAEIIVGLIIGQSGFDLVNQSTWLETLSTLGFIFLMFLSGLEIDFSIFAGKNKRKNEKQPSQSPFIISLVIFLGILILSVGLSYAFVLAGFIDNVFLMTLIISTISLGVVVPTLKEAQMMKSTFGQTILMIAVIADLVTMILLAVFATIYGDEGGNMWLLLILFAVGVILYFVGKIFQKRSFIETMSKGTVQIGTRAVFTLIIVLVAVSESVGAENILGAFLAGTLVSLLSPNQELVHQLDSFGYGFLIPIFFVMVGVEMNLRTLLTDPQILILIPLLLIALLISKIVPVLYLRRWYDWRSVISAGTILTSTLSLVIAAAAIGERIGVIDAQMEGALILVAVISCIITPWFFKRFYVRYAETDKKNDVAFIGANQLTMPSVRNLDERYYRTHLYHTKLDKLDESLVQSEFDIQELDNYEPAQLEALGVFNVDILVVSTGDEEQNSQISLYAKELGVDRVIARIEQPALSNELKENDIEVFSVLLSTNALLKALIEAPSVMNILTNQDNALYQVSMQNPAFDGVSLRQFPFHGDLIIVRIFRGKDSIVPHGDTVLRMDDRLIVTGSGEYVDDLHELLE